VNEQSKKGKGAGMESKLSNHSTHLPLVRSVMKTEVLTVQAEDTLIHAFETMAKGQARTVVVIDNESKVQGFVSDTDIITAHCDVTEWTSRKVHAIMKRSLPYINPDSTLSEAIDTMISKDINLIPVVKESGCLCGLITSVDIIKSYAKVLESLRPEAR